MVQAWSRRRRREQGQEEDDVRGRRRQRRWHRVVGQRQVLGVKEDGASGIGWPVVAGEAPTFVREAPPWTQRQWRWRSVDEWARGKI
jgi:hypothetical protein